MVQKKANARGASTVDVRSLQTDLAVFVHLLVRYEKHASHTNPHPPVNHKVTEQVKTGKNYPHMKTVSAKKMFVVQSSDKLMSDLL